MKRNFFSFTLIAFFLSSFSLLKAAEKDTASEASLSDSLHIQYLKYDTTGSVTIGNNLATFNIPKGFKFLNPQQSNHVMHDLWGNPPSHSLGMIFPSEASEVIPSTWAIEITYEEDGHVKDDDARDIKYNDLLKDMQKELEESNPERKKEGYATAKLLGWASPPYYDEKEKKLHWAKRILFEGDTTETLNYNVRILGRKGVLVLNAIGGMSDLNEIKTDIPSILSSVNFKDGNRYADFDSSVDKVAAYGIAGLIAGGVLLKTGLLAKIGILLLKFIKPILVGAAAIGGGIWRFITGKKKDEGTQA